MTMYQAAAGNTEMARMLEDERRHTEQLVDQLAEQAAHQQRKAIEGMVALPAAIALGIATVTIRIVAFTARALEVFQRAAMEARQEYRGQDFQRERTEAARQQEQPRA